MMQKVTSFHNNVSKIWQIFMVGVNSVHPKEIIKSFVKREGEKLVIGNAKYDLNNNVYIIGFGKAVIGMVNPLENVLKISPDESHLQKGILSVPVGIRDTLDLQATSESSHRIEYFEGAANNIPDEKSFAASKRIVSLVKSLTEHDLLLVLMSGGGSALFPYPVPPLTLDEKSNIIKTMSRGGASIYELNTVRKSLSITKGGGIALLSKARIVSLMLSDVIGNAFDIISSGPTMLNNDSIVSVKEILQKYDVTITDQVNKALQSRREQKVSDFDHVSNNIIGSIEIALSAIETHLKNYSEIPSCALVLSSSLVGEAADIGRSMATFTAMLTQMIHSDQQHQDLFDEKILKELCIDSSKEDLLKSTVAKCRQEECPLWLIFGGETTVTVKGSGKGGRNQEMVLSAGIHIEKRMEGSSFKGEVVLMSGGTDGIDGPTDAGGALTYWASHNDSYESQILEAKKQDLVAEVFLQDNASYSYFSRLSSGRYHFKPGHTGTNVMDIQILLINPTY